MLSGFLFFEPFSFVFIFEVVLYIKMRTLNALVFYKLVIVALERFKFLPDIFIVIDKLIYFSKCHFASAPFL